MSRAFGPARVVVGRTAARRFRADLAALLAALRAGGLDVEVAETAGPGEATAATRQALDEDVRYVVAAGDDGVVHEVVNGLVEPDPGAPSGLRAAAADAVLGVAGLGVRDFARTFGLDRRPEVVARHLLTDTTMPIDLGVVDYVDEHGRAARRVFANIAEVGYAADLQRRAARMPRVLGRVGRLLAAYAAIARLDRQETAVEVAANTLTVPVVNVVVANGQFVADGSKIAPRALPDDGKFNVQIFTGERSQVFTLTSRIHRGEHLPDRDIVELQAPTAALAPPTPLPVAADGVPLGATPARFSLLHQVVRLKI